MDCWINIINQRINCKMEMSDYINDDYFAANNDCLDNINIEGDKKMSGFDNSKNKEFKRVVVTSSDENTRVIISVCSYDGGERKLQFSRQNKKSGVQGDEDPWIFAKLGRLTKEESAKIPEAVATLLPTMEVEVDPEIPKEEKEEEKKEEEKTPETPKVDTATAEEEIVY